MSKIHATITLFTTQLGGRRSPMTSSRPYHCPLFFASPIEIAQHGFDCRILINELEINLYPGETANNIPIIFLSPEEIFPYLKINMSFNIWENGYIGEGIITKIFP
ncbi:MULTISPECIES: hypothetical protein [Enterobacterales]|uniref:hypothetical protein n=1 Tax=Enterobacterales TaxID=91347 RepID=UPI000847E24D|nr:MULTISPECIES: hypothetical protein [Enterobacterales]WOO51425.1 hypothetical protein R2S03_09790 [Hafnia alvei]MCT6518112.1 hypothetical protein [Proteus vulgaris]ODQ04686.1 hypothetical protein BGK50_06430 [Shigella sp. FC130]OEI92219.1 hypothetical protein BHE86_07920 [Shigella sp. FC1655]OEJ06859.1 hypothetical protein BHE89_19240 [Shigella sp. FC1967]